MTKRTDNRDANEGRQAQQARLIEQARRIPGVTEATDVYEMLHGRAGAVAATVPVVRYATGGNE